MPLLQRLEHACKLGAQLRVSCLCCALDLKRRLNLKRSLNLKRCLNLKRSLNCCVVCTLVQLPLPAYQDLLLRQPCCFFILVAVADLMGCNGLLSALERGWADTAASLVPISFVHPPDTQPVLALGLSLRS